MIFAKTRHTVTSPKITTRNISNLIQGEASQICMASCTLITSTSLVGTPNLQEGKKSPGMAPTSPALMYSMHITANSLPCPSSSSSHGGERGRISFPLLSDGGRDRNQRRKGGEGESEKIVPTYHTCGHITTYPIPPCLDRRKRRENTDTNFIRMGKEGKHALIAIFIPDGTYGTCIWGNVASALFSKIVQN